MQSSRDPLERALSSLSSGGWAHGNHERQLEEVLMKEFDRSARRSRRGAIRGLWIAGLAVLIGGAGFAATGGREVVRKVLIRVHLIGADGAVFEGELAPLGESGDYQTQVALEDGRQADLQIRVAPDEIGVERRGKQVTVQVQGEGGIVSAEKINILRDVESVAGAPQTIQIEMISDDADGAVHGELAPLAAFTASADPIVVDDIDEPERTVEWIDADGAAHVLSVVRNAEDDVAGTGFKLFREQEDGTYFQVGELRAPAEVEIDEIDVDDEGGVSIAILADDGRRMVVQVSGGLSPRGTDETIEPSLPRTIRARDAE